ncbi:MAG: HAD family hydrolase [Clostridia bacterium]|nr:HAD family hydrolase [Clostridia bacterium]
MLRAVYDPYVCLRDFGERTIRYAFHDVDGTHSLIRNWPPVMSVVLNDVIERGLPEDFDSAENCARLIGEAGRRPLAETDRFCVESAGLSALTQMEWAIRRAVEEGRVQVACDQSVNSEKARRIFSGEERFDGLPDTPEMQMMLSDKTPRLFRLYERVLNGYCRDRNLMLARENPDLFRVKGSMAFLQRLKDAGVKNYFVTGAVVEKGKGMYEEVETLGYAVGEGKMIEAIIGSSWDSKMPKDEIMRELLSRLNARGEDALVTGDGRSEIAAGVEMGALTLSRLNPDAERQRALHVKLGTHMIVTDFEDAAIDRVFFSH